MYFVEVLKTEGKRPVGVRGYRAAEGDAVGGAAREEVDLASIDELELAGAIGDAFADTGHAESHARYDVVDELRIASHGGGRRRRWRWGRRRRSSPP